jgi:hypothetical protein
MAQTVSPQRSPLDQGASLFKYLLMENRTKDKVINGKWILIPYRCENFHLTFLNIIVKI